MKNYCQLEHLQFPGEPSGDDDDQPSTSSLGFSRDHISNQVSTPKIPFYVSPRTRKSPAGRQYCSNCSSPVRDYYDNYFHTISGYGYISPQVQYSPKLAKPFLSPIGSFKSFKIQDSRNCRFCGYGYPYLVVTPHNTTITPRRTIRDENNEEDEGDDDGVIDGLLLERILNVCQSLPENLRAQLIHLEGLDDEVTSVDGNLKVSSTTSRGLGGPMDDLSLKLERFKIRTVDVDDIVTPRKEKK